MPEELVKSVLGADLSELQEMLRRGAVNSEGLVHIFGARCQSHGRRLNLVTQEYYEIALAEAKKKDTEREEKKREGNLSHLGPLHGIPVSIKDHIFEQGKPATVGCSFRVDHRATEDAAVIKMLTSEGAIPMVRTNMV